MLILNMIAYLLICFNNKFFYSIVYVLFNLPTACKLDIIKKLDVFYCAYKYKIHINI